MTDSKLLDSSVWLEYLLNGKFKDLIESDKSLMVSSLSLFEIKKKLIMNRKDKQKIAESIAYIKEGAIIVNVTPSIAEQAVDISITHKIAAVDAIIYTSALQNDSFLLTCDNDFRGLPHVEIVSG